MREKSFPYCIPDKRELTPTESALLAYLVEQVDGIDVDVSDLKVIARCGCGQCPTILLGKSMEDEPITSADSDVVMEWMGKAENGALVGILLFAAGEMPTELEAYSVAGDDIDAWPPLTSIRRM